MRLVLLLMFLLALTESRRGRVSTTTKNKPPPTTTTTTRTPPKTTIVHRASDSGKKNKFLSINVDDAKVKQGVKFAKNVSKILGSFFEEPSKQHQPQPQPTPAIKQHSPITNATRPSRPRTTTTTPVPKTTVTTTTPIPLKTTTVSRAAVAEDNERAYLAFKIQDPKFTKQVKRLHEIALNVSKDFEPYFVDPATLHMPLLSFHFEEEDDFERLAHIYDRALELALCPLLPRRIGFHEFRLQSYGYDREAIVGGRYRSSNWPDRVTEPLIEALERLGFIRMSKEDGFVYVITTPNKSHHSLREIDTSSATLTASAFVDSLLICRGTPPNEQKADPCDVLREIRLATC